MARIVGNQIQNISSGYGEDDVKFFSIKASGGKANIRFLYNSIEEIEAMSLHEVQVNGKNRKVDCLREHGAPVDTCPLCAAGIDLRNRFFFTVYNYNTNQVEVWERGKNDYDKFTTIFQRQPMPISGSVYEVTRNGQGLQTTYDIWPVQTDGGVPTQFGAEPDLDGFIIHSDFNGMHTYLQTGNFPQEGGNVAQPQQGGFQPMTPQAQPQQAFQPQAQPQQGFAPQPQQQAFQPMGGQPQQQGYQQPYQPEQVAPQQVGFQPQPQQGVEVDYRQQMMQQQMGSQAVPDQPYNQQNFVPQQQEPQAQPQQQFQPQQAFVPQPQVDINAPNNGIVDASNPLGGINQFDQGAFADIPDLGAPQAQPQAQPQQQFQPQAQPQPNTAVDRGVATTGAPRQRMANGGGNGHGF